MDHNSFLPDKYLSLTAEFHTTCHSIQSQVIYITILVSVIACVAILPFVPVEVSIRCPGLLRASTELTTLKSVSTGSLKRVLVHENEAVEQGQLLFELQSPVMETRTAYLNNRMAETNEFRTDLRFLISFAEPSETPDSLSVVVTTPLWRQSLSDYRRKITDRKIRLNKAKQDYLRNKKLFDERVIAAAEIELFRFELDKAIGEVELLKQSQITQWQQELRTYDKDYSDLLNQLDQTRHEVKNLIVTAPVKGTLQNLSGIYPGSPVIAGQSLAEISPDSELLAEIQVAPSDVGLLHEGMKVRMQIHAFNYNQWGMLNGTIREISSDVHFLHDQPFFSVRCALDQDYLKMKNGFVGKFRKGMTLQARFIVASRSLWQLLFDTIDHWLNPNLIHPA